MIFLWPRKLTAWTSIWIICMFKTSRCRSWFIFPLVVDRHRCVFHKSLSACQPDGADEARSSEKVRTTLKVATINIQAIERNPTISHFLVSLSLIISAALESPEQMSRPRSPRGPRWVLWRERNHLFRGGLWKALNHLSAEDERLAQWSCLPPTPIGITFNIKANCTGTLQRKTVLQRRYLTLEKVYTIGWSWCICLTNIADILW